MMVIAAAPEIVAEASRVFWKRQYNAALGTKTCLHTNPGINCRSTEPDTINSNEQSPYLSELSQLG